MQFKSIYLSLHANCGNNSFCHTFFKSDFVLGCKSEDETSKERYYQWNQLTLTISNICFGKKKRGKSSFVSPSLKLQCLNTVFIAIIIFNSNFFFFKYDVMTQCNSLSYVCTQGSRNIPGHTCHTFGHHSWPCKDTSQQSQYKFHLLCRWCDSRMEYSLGNHSNHCYTWNIKSEVQLIEVTNIC